MSPYFNAITPLHGSAAAAAAGGGGRSVMRDESGQGWRQQR